jgi:hypothetical protein
MAARPHSASPVELKEQIEAERRGEPFLVYRDADGRQQIVGLGSGSARLSVGRGDSSDIPLPWDADVSRLHAVLERIGDDWTVSDDGLSRNGTFVNAERIAGRRRLHDGDTVRFGSTTAVFRDPLVTGAIETNLAADGSGEIAISDAERRVLVALCAPYKVGTPYAAPASNREIADRLHVSVDTVKTHLRVLFEKLGVDHLPQNQKRAKLVERAFQSGVLSPRDL